MFKEQNERKENTVRVDSWTKHPCVPLSFDDRDQYLDFMSVWAGGWSSCDPGHMERTDHCNTFGSNDCIGELDSDEFDDSDAEWFLEKDRSRALRRRSTALHKLHVQDVWGKLSKKVVPCVRVKDAEYGRCIKSVSEILSVETDQSKLYELPSTKVYRRMFFPCGQSVELTTLYDELDAIIDTLTNEEYFDIISLFYDRYSLEASYLYPSEHVVGTAPIFSKRGMHYKKYAELYSHKANHEEGLADERKRLEQECKRLAVERKKLSAERQKLKKKLNKLSGNLCKSKRPSAECNKLLEELKALTQECKRLVAERKRLKKIVTGSKNTPECRKSSSEDESSISGSAHGSYSNSDREGFVDRHVVGLRSTTPALPVNLQGTNIPVVLAKPQHIALVFPYVSTAGLPFHR